MNRRQGTCNSEFLKNILSNYFPRENLTVRYFTKFKNI